MPPLEASARPVELGIGERALVGAYIEPAVPSRFAEVLGKLLRVAGRWAHFISSVDKPLMHTRVLPCHWSIAAQYVREVAAHIGGEIHPEL